MSNLTLNVSLSPQLAKFVHSKVDSGLYASASEVVREALRWFADRNGGARPDVPMLLDVQEQEIDREQAQAAVARLRRLRKGITLGPGLSIADLRDSGRR